MDDYLVYCLPPLATLVAAWIILLIIGRILRACGTAAQESGPDVAGVPGGPGQLLLSHFDAFNRAMSALSVQISAMPLLLYGAYVTYVSIFPEHGHWFGTAILVMGGAAFEIERFLKLRKIKAAYRAARLAYEDKLVTSQAMIPLMHEGYIVFHSVHRNGSTIDHIVLGHKGVFAIHTHTHPRAAEVAGANGNIVRYDGRILLFGDNDEHAAIERAEQATEQFSEWISETLPEAVAARAILSLPGWVVKRTSVEGISVVNPKQFDSLFHHIGPRPLAPEIIKAISDKIMATYRQGRPHSTTPCVSQAAPARADA
jgi:hypothetical protein